MTLLEFRMRKLFLLPLLLAAAAQAQIPVPPAADPAKISPGIAPGPSTLIHAESFSQLDTNGDGVIDPSEAQHRPALASQFNTVDVDHSGAVDDSEFAVFESDLGMQVPAQK